MSTYVIGDLHGCLDELQLLLEKISFNKETDLLWFTGDLIIGGNKSLETLRFIKNLENNVICVLGNHDLTLLGLAVANIKMKEHIIKEFEPILNSPDKKEIVSWLRQLPLLHYDEKYNTLLVHAGIAPQWTIEKAINLAKEVEDIIQSEHATDFFLNMFGNKPEIWNDNLINWERARCITNYLTRLRFCSKEGHMNLLEKGPPHTPPPNLMPWYSVPNRLSKNTRIIFGHWAALEGEAKENNIVAIDTGCMWGNYLSAIRLEDNKIFKIKSLATYEQP
jgi:bis(5'-nucleosyl)-tetraphosphatase (symmetrical)